MAYTLDFSLNRMTYDLMQHVRSNITDDIHLSKRQVQDWIRNTRAMFMQNDLNKGKLITDDFKQDFCLELEVVDAAECCDVNLDCHVLRSTQKIPTPIYYRGGAAITRVATVGVTSTNITFGEQNRIIYSGNGRFNKRRIFSFYKDNYVYVIGGGMLKDTLKYVTVEGVFDTPEDAAKLKRCDGSPCFTADSRYPISRAAYEFMKRNVIQTDLVMQAQAPSDNTNDAQDKVEPNK